MLKKFFVVNFFVKKIILKNKNPSLMDEKGLNKNKFENDYLINIIFLKSSKLCFED